MEPVSTTIIAILAAALILRLGTVKGLWVFFAVLPLGASAAVNLPALGGASIVLADAAAAALCLSFVMERRSISASISTLRPPSSGFFLILLFAYATFATIYFPRLFAGSIEVFGLARIDGEVGIVSRPLRPSSGNITQFLRFSIGVIVFLVIATAIRRNPDTRAVLKAMTAVTVIHIAFGFLDVTSFRLGFAQLLDFFRTANYAMATNQFLGGLKRMVGGFPEASAFGYLTIGLFGFWLQYWTARGRARIAAWLVLAILVTLILSASTSAYAAGFIFLLCFGASNAGQFLRQEVDVRLFSIAIYMAVSTVIVGTALVVAYQTIPDIQSFFDRLIFNKLQSHSGQERMSWNGQAFRNYLDTGTLGAGLGSVRASNWFLACLASLGTFGTLLFLLFVGSVFRNRYTGDDTETAIVFGALKMACLALLIRALIVKATPNLELSFFAMSGVLVGLAASAQVRHVAHGFDELLPRNPARRVGL